MGANRERGPGRRGRGMGQVVNVLVGVAVVYGLIVLGAFLIQRRLMYFPDPARIAPASVGLTGYNEETITTGDGERIVTWRSPARAGQPTVLYLHGNAGGLATRAERLGAFAREGWGVAIMAYRGYAGSSGAPTEAANVADAQLLYDRLVAGGIPPASIVVYGESLGSGVAVQLAASRKVRAVVLDSPYTSAADVAVRSYPFLPVRPLLKDRYESARHIAGVRAPVLVIHGELDRVIPVEMGRAMYGLAPGPKHLVTFPRGGHSDLFQHGALAAIRGWLGEIRVVEAR